MSKESCLQVLAYYALMKTTNPNIQYVGFILPMQRDLVLYNLNGWDATQYLNLQEADKLAQPIPENIMLRLGDNIIMIKPEEGCDMNALFNQLAVMGFVTNNESFDTYLIGSHISKGKNIVTTLNDYVNKYPNLPCQMFLTNPRTGRRDAKTANQIAGAKEIIYQSGLRYFTHAPYVINLCANQCDDDGIYWQQRILNEDIDFTVAMGGKGVVVHTGCRKHISEDDALIIMEYMVRTALAHATEECPLLLESPCGEGSEVCYDIQDLGNFFLRFTVEEQKKLGLCVDTAHIHAANYDCMDYLQQWEQCFSIPIRLVHFNDSSVLKGSHVDRHASPGSGYIGFEMMNAVAE